MKLLQEILTNLLSKEEIHITFPELSLDARQLLEGECYRALQKIKAVIDDNSLDDCECFEKIEEIVCIFESIGSGCGSRHDFG